MQIRFSKAILVLVPVWLLVMIASSAAPGNVMKMLGTASIAGRVVDDAGNPVQHISINVFDEHKLLKRATFTDVDGSYTADRLAPGIYDVAVASVSQELARQSAVASGTRNVNFRVALCTIRGHVKSPDGTMLGKSVSVRALSLDWALERSVNASERSDFILKQLPPTIVELTATSTGYREAVMKVDLRNHTSQDVILELQPTCRLDIQVLEKTSKLPLEGVTLNVVEPRAGTPTYVYLGETDSAGRFTYRLAKPGRQNLVAANPLHESPRVAVDARPDAITKATVLVDRPSIFVGRIEGIEDVPKLKVTIQADPIPLLPLPGDHGAYNGIYRDGTFVVHVPPGRYRVQAFADASQPELMGARIITIPESPVLSIGRGEKMNVSLKANIADRRPVIRH